MAVKRLIIRRSPKREEEQPNVDPAIMRAAAMLPPAPVPVAYDSPAPLLVHPIPQVGEPQPLPLPPPADPPVPADVDPSIVRAAQLPENQPAPIPAPPQPSALLPAVDAQGQPQSGVAERIGVDVDPSIRRAAAVVPPPPITGTITARGNYIPPEQTRKQYHDDIREMPEIPGAPGAHLHDPDTGPIGPTSPRAERVASRRYTAPLTNTMRAVHDALLAEITRQRPDVEPTDFRGLTLDPRGALNEPMSDPQQGWHNQVLANPHEEYQRVAGRDGDLTDLATELVDEMVHELTHQRVQAHNAAFTQTEEEFQQRTRPLREHLTQQVAQTLRQMQTENGGAAWREFVEDAESRPEHGNVEKLLARPSYPATAGIAAYQQGQAGTPMVSGGPDLSGITENPIVQGVAGAVGAGLEAVGSLPVAPMFPNSPTFGDVTGTALDTLQAAGELGSGLASAAGFGFPGIPGSGAPTTPETISARARREIAEGIAARNPQSPVEWLTATVDSVREYAATRPESWPNERIIHQSITDLTTLLPGVGIGDDVARAIARTATSPQMRAAAKSLAASGEDALRQLQQGRHVGGAAFSDDAAQELQRMEEVARQASNVPTPPPPPPYDPLTNVAAADEARILLANDPAAARSRVFDDTTPPDDVTRATAHLMVLQAQSSGDAPGAITAATKSAGRSLAAGDVEGLSALGQLTPDSVIALAHATVKQAQEAGHKGARLLPWQENKLRASAEAVNTMPEGRSKILATLVLSRQVAEIVPPTFARKLGTIHVAAQLLNPKTIGRNIIGNAIFAGFENATRLMAVGLDIPMSLATGQRSVTTPNVWTQLRGLATGAVEGTQDAVRGVNTSGVDTGAKFELGPGRSFRSGVPEVMEPGLTPAERAVRVLGMPAHYAETALNLSLQMPDRAFYQAAVDDDLLRIAKVTAMNAGLKGEAQAKRVAELLAQPTKEMMEEAKATALFRTMNNDSMAAALASGIKKSLNIVGIGPRNPKGGILDRYAGQFGLGDFVVKYPRMPANMLMRAVDYSPLGLLNAAAEVGRPLFDSTKTFNQRAFVEALSRATIGTTGLTVAGQHLAALGLITGKGPVDPDTGQQDWNASNFYRQQGTTPYRANMSGLKRWIVNGFDPRFARVQDGDRWVSYGWAAPMALPVAFGANRVEAKRAADVFGKPAPAESVWDQLSQAATAGNDALRLGWDLFSDQGVAQGVIDLAGADNHTEAIVKVLQKAPASFVPTLLSQANQLLDNHVRDTWDPDVWQGAANGVLAKLPVLAATLPVRRDVFGDPIQRFPDGNDMWSVLLNPADTATYLPSAAAKMVLHLGDAARRTAHFPPAVFHSVYVNGVRREFPDATTASEYQRVLGEKVNRAFTDLAQLDEFRGRPEEEQITLLRRALFRLEADAQRELWGRTTEAGGGVSPVGDQAPVARGKFNEDTAAAFAKAEPLLKRYDNIEAEVRRLVPVYEQVAREMDLAEMQKDAAAIARIKAMPA